jgi:integrase/recombinase XerD
MTGFDNFIRERRYVYNVSPATISWYTHAFNWLPCESPTQSELTTPLSECAKKE